MERTDGSSIVDLPPELLLYILLYLDVPDILCLRKTCQQLNLITRERPTWIHLFKFYQAFTPIPYQAYKDYHHTGASIHAYPTDELERLVRYARYTTDIWTESRNPPFRLHAVPTTADHGGLIPVHDYRKGSTVFGMQLFLDRWLLVIYAEGLANLYDVSQHGGPGEGFLPNDTSRSLKRKLLKAQLDKEPWNSCFAAYDDVSSKIILVVARTSYMIDIYSISIDSLNASCKTDHFIPNLFQHIGSKILPTHQSIRYVDPTRQVLILSSSNKIEVCSWNKLADANGTGNQLTWETNPKSNHLEAQTTFEDLEEMWNGVLGARLLGDYVLVFKTRSIEIFHYHFPRNTNNISSNPITDCPIETDRTHVQLKHAFSLTFRDVSFSDITHTWIPASNTDSYEFKLLAYDVIQGLFQYVVRLLVPRHSDLNSTQHQPVESTLDVNLLGVYPLSFGGAFRPSKHGTLISSVSSSLALPSSSISGTSTPSPIATHSSSIFQSSSTTSGTRGVRGFISAHSMGPQGKRAVWVERKRTSIVREVQVWAMEPPSPLSGTGVGGDEDTTDEDSNLPAEFENQVVYTASSYDLRDDIVLCTFSELHGTIILGHRSGEVSVLDLGRTVSSQHE